MFLFHETLQRIPIYTLQTYSLQLEAVRLCYLWAWVLSSKNSRSSPISPFRQGILARCYNTPINIAGSVRETATELDAGMRHRAECMYDMPQNVRPFVICLYCVE